MRRLLFVVAATGLLLAALAPVVAGDGSNKFAARLNGYLETPSISGPGRGSFHLRIHGPEIKFSLSYQNMPQTPVVAHIHFGRPDVAGGVSVFLCGGGGRPACPASGAITGTIVSTDVVGPTGQGIAAGEYAELVRAIRNGATYVNVHTAAFPAGEIRGNIHRD
jgi:hypothetical protein